MVHDQRIQRGAASFSRFRAEGGRGGWSVAGLGAVLFLLAAFVLSSSGVDGEPRGMVENPGANSYQSGIGVISGWVCEAEAVEIEIGDFLPQAAAYGTERMDTVGGVWGRGQWVWVVVQLEPAGGRRAYGTGAGRWGRGRAGDLHGDHAGTRSFCGGRRGMSGLRTFRVRGKTVQLVNGNRPVYRTL